MVPIEMSSPLYAYLVPLGHSAQHGRQMTDRAIGIGRLYTVALGGGIKTISQDDLSVEQSDINTPLSQASSLTTAQWICHSGGFFWRIST